MKTRPGLLLAAAVFATFIPAGCATASPAAERNTFTLQLAPGSSPAAARSVLGAPDATLDSQLWIYWNYGPNRLNPELDTLVVAFEENRVIAVKITDGRVVRRWLAQADRYAKAGTVAAAPAMR